jgi:hypothetical protein
LINSFKELLGNFTPGVEYKLRPPYGPLDELPTLSKDEIDALNFDAFGSNPESRGKTYAFKTINFKIEDRLLPQTVALPSMSSFEDIYIFGVSGHNVKVSRGAFYFILAKSNLLNFRYSIHERRPFFYNTNKTVSALMSVDNNIFKDGMKEKCTEAYLNDNALIDRIYEGEYDKPFAMGFKPDESASSQALGWGVKLQQMLELASIKDIPTDRKVICIKSGPLFSTSVAPEIVVKTLKPVIENWTNQIYIACSDNAADSHLLIEALIENVSLRKLWFPNQNISNEQLMTIGSDLFILDKILLPGQRTPLIEAIERARVMIVSQEPKLTPVTCYYRSRKKPYPYLRIEIPKHLFQTKKAATLEAIDILVWQYELGKKAPLIQVAANQLSKLSAEKAILERQTAVALEKSNLNLPTQL